MFESHRVLHRYVIWEYLKIFSLSLTSLLLIYVIVLFFQKIDFFIKHQAPFHLVFLYLLYKIPEVIFQWTLPYGVLVATLLPLGTLSRHSEITAMKAGGVSLYRITFPLFFIVLFISLCSFLGNEYLVPLTNHKTRHLLSVQATPFRELEVSLAENWESFESIERQSREMSYTDLRIYVQRIQAAGYDSTRYLVELYAKLSYPFLNLIMILIE